MKNLQRQSDRFVVWARELSSRGSSFIIVMLGVMLQASHTTLLMYEVAAFDQPWLRFTVAMGIGLFISCALAVFTLKYDGKNLQIKQIINVFFYFEVFTNIFYYWNSIILLKDFNTLEIKDWIYVTVAMPFAYIMPYAIKQFAGVISSDNRLEFGDIDAIQEQSDMSTSQIAILDERFAAIEQGLSGINDTLSKINPDEFLKRGEHVQITVGDGEDKKKSIITLG